MQGKIPRSALLLASFLLLSLSTSGYATAARADEPEPTTLLEILKKRFGGNKAQGAVPEVVTPASEVKPVAPKKVIRPARAKAPDVKGASVVLPKEAPIPLPSPRGAVEVGNALQDKSDLGAVDEANLQKDVDQIKDGIDIVEAAKQPDAIIEADSDREEPLGFANLNWKDAPDGFRFHSASARRLMTEGRPDLALVEIDFAKEKAVSLNQVNEVKRLRAVADILMGKEVYSKVATGKEAPSDWRAVEVARAGVNGERPEYSVFLALDEVLKWPEPVAAMIVRHFAPLVDDKSAEPLLIFAEKLHRDGSLNPSVLPLVKGYVHKLKGERKEAGEEFKKASRSVLGGVAGRAKLELLEVDILEQEVVKEDVVAAATDIINIGSGDHVQRRALRILIEFVEGVDKINALRSLEKIERDERKREVINQQLDSVLSQIAEEQRLDKEEKSSVSEVVVGDGEIAGVEEQKDGGDVELDEPVWLLEDEIKPEPLVKKRRLSLKEIHTALEEANGIVQTFEETK